MKVQENKDNSSLILSVILQSGNLLCHPRRRTNPSHPPKTNDDDGDDHH